MPKLANRQPVLKPQDFCLLLVLAACRGRGTTYPELAALSGLSMSEVHGALKRAEAARLLHFDQKRPRILAPAFREFLYHGAKYAFPPLRGSLVAGVPTAHAAAPLNAHIAPSADPAPVWPDLKGTVRGLALIPLYPSAPAAALREYLAARFEEAILSTDFENVLPGLVTYDELHEQRVQAVRQRIAAIAALAGTGLP